MGALFKVLSYLPLVGRLLKRAESVVDAVREPPPVERTVDEWLRDEDEQRERLRKQRER